MQIGYTYTRIYTSTIHHKGLANIFQKRILNEGRARTQRKITTKNCVMVESFSILRISLIFLVSGFSVVNVRCRD